jgi:hypothetical protein
MNSAFGPIFQWIYLIPICILIYILFGIPHIYKSISISILMIFGALTAAATILIYITN